MNKRNLTAAFLACAICAIVMTGTACAPQPCYTDEAEPTVAVSVVDPESSEVTTDETLEEDVDDVAVLETNSDQAEVEAAVGSKNEVSSVDTKPAAKADPRPTVKKSTQYDVVHPKQKSQPEAAIASSEAESGGEDADDEILMVIDAIPADSEEGTAKASTITINGVEIDYTDSYGTASAPSEGAGIWRGSDSTTDGSYAYFIGHDYTEFGDIANLEQGSSVSVTDSNGDSCDYEVVDSFVVPRDSYWSDISDRVTGYGESVVMQTCVEDGYLIVVAE